MPAAQGSELSDCHDSEALSLCLFRMCGSNPPDLQIYSEAPAMRRLGSCVWYAWVDSCRQARWQEWSRARQSPTEEGLAGQWNAGQQ